MEKEKKEKLLNFISWLIKDRLDVKTNILYVAEFGSSLYGLTTEKSDTDIVCIYSPSEEMLLLLNNHENYKNVFHFSYESKEHSNEKNTENDIDIKFFSIQEVIKRISYSDYQMCDILFSHTHKDKIIYETPIMRKKIFDCYEPLIDISHSDSFLKYAQNQVKKYAPRNSPLGIAKLIIDEIENIKNDKLKLEDIFEERIYPFIKKPNTNALNRDYAEYYEYDETIKGIKMFGKVFLYNLKIKDFYKRVLDFYNVYGERAKLAKQSLSVDWKACSHAYRALINYKQLSFGNPILFPYTGEDYNLLMKIKTGQMTWDEFEVIFSTLYEELINNEADIKSNFCKTTSKNTLLSFYKK